MLAVSTGVDQFVNPEKLGPLYPFVGIEAILFGLVFFLWLAWHFMQARGETHEHREACALYEEIGLDRAMHHGGSALLATDAEWDEHQRQGGAPAVRRDFPPDTVGRPPHGEPR